MDVSTTLSGFLIVDKPAGVSSMRAVGAVRRRAGGVKTGHAGTLDPLATGVLIMALGRATRLIDRFMALAKRYRTTIDLSAFTSTDDLEGERQEVGVGQTPSREDVHAAIGRLTGRIMQQPPAFSAMKVGGRRAYRLARQGKPVALAPRPVLVHAIDVLSYEWPLVELSIHCAKGVYVRSLARDLGRLLATGGHCVSLRRTAIGPFPESKATPLDELPQTIGAEHLIAVEYALAMVSDETMAAKQNQA